MEENSDNEKFDAFEFNTDDEAVELVSEKFVDKFTSNPASLYLQPVSSEADFQPRNMDDIDVQANDFSDEGDSSSPSSPSSSDLGENEGYLEDPASHSFSDGLELVDTALVKLHVRETTVVGDSHGPPDVVVLNFAIYDDRWARKQEKITSLNARYKAVWYEVAG
ncbi:hypothetical protein C5167_020443 [Papaver somniferum]|uniref:Probable ubiquitin-like-specific protease 2A/B PH domain-containing protein n=1 Tax=Papaver somniferum TaxID=3469 RepID=A0A4Y7IX12_PAPSO|nr:hypothetical protein C5167_020443 [Papaver somniferum]